ncbi:type II/IV secretion system ATPase subunit [Methanoculleus sp.]|uniref:type II/IV secretion system ATPase subunit n=1 Tax=Methanoculleus sp. TaxID=90427 RepID=UPI0025DFAF86|nr:ATPase, T2SS/T4P/T4SS family [Methanoculleus sp.]
MVDLKGFVRTPLRKKKEAEPETAPGRDPHGGPSAPPLPPGAEDFDGDEGGPGEAFRRAPGIREKLTSIPPGTESPGDDEEPDEALRRAPGAPFPAGPEVGPRPVDSDDPDAAALPHPPGKPARLLSMEDVLSRRPQPGDPAAPSRFARIPFLAKFLPRPAKPETGPQPGDPAAPSRLARIPFLAQLLSLLSREKEPELTSSAFFVGDTGEPSLDGSLKDVCITYAVDPPYQYIHIEYDREARALSYSVVEPQLSGDEAHYLGLIKKAFEKMIGTNADLVSAEHRVAYLREHFDSIITILGFRFTDEQRERIYFHLKREYIGYGRIDALMKDRYIEDISCNGANMDLYVQHRIYGPVRTNVRFDDLELNNFVLKLAQISGRHISLLQPIRDITLPDGSRGNLTLGGEVTRKGSTFTIRKFRSNPISPIEMMDYGTVDAQQLAYLWILMEYKRSLLVSGGTASGKTTFLNALCGFIPTEYKIVSIEDTTELNLMHPNWLQSVTRMGFGTGDAGGAPSGVGGGGRKAPGDISLYDLLIAALRQRPEFIIVGEVRGDEAFTLFQAIAVGHAAMGTIHAGSMDELLSRVESSPMNLPRNLLANLDAVIFPMQIRKGERNVRRITNIVEILELDREKGDLVTNTVFKWLPATDEFKFMGRSYLFDKIRDTFGISLEDLRQEMADRADLLLWLQDQQIRDYKVALGFIRAYYKDKDEIMAQVRDGTVITADDIAALVARAAVGNGDGPEAQSV